ncbi:MAG TPA: Asp-tRNA(Asn)/Glu-tRNA(Gln) amidotransferase subunit GatC [Chthoniobacterales bacterium]
MSSSDSKFDVRHIAHLARIELTDAETAKFQSQISEVLAHVAQLQSVDVTGVEPTAHTYPIFNVFRDDNPRDWFTPEKALGNAPHQANQLFVVPKVLE